jgi:hypothetical protein
VARALETVRLTILPVRQSMATEAEGSHDRRAVSDIVHLRPVVVTDSRMFHTAFTFLTSLCLHDTNSKTLRLRCRRHVLLGPACEKGLLVTKAGEAVENSQAVMGVMREARKLSTVGVQVVYYLVAAEENKEADMLAKGSIV